MSDLEDAGPADASAARDASAPFPFVRTIPMCGWDGVPGWAITFSGEPDTCGGLRTPYLLLQVSASLDEAAAVTYTMGGVGDPAAQGIAWLCERGHTLCTYVAGTVYVESFETGGVARVGFDLRDVSGVSVVSPPVPVAVWCPPEGPTCR